MSLHLRPFIFSLCYLSTTFSLVFGQAYDIYQTGNPSDVVTKPSGGICLMGGGSESDPAMQWFLERADGGDILVLRASGSDGYNEYMYSELEVNVNSVTTIVCKSRENSYDPTIIKHLQNAEAIWFAGGDQANYINYWRNTPVDSIINLKLQSGLVIGGTSAGMAILGGYYFTAYNGTINSEEALKNPLNEKIILESQKFVDLPLMTSILTDTHFGERNRQGRLVAFMANIYHQSNENIFAIACDEHTAVCIDSTGIARVFGDYPSYDDVAYFLSINCQKKETTPEKIKINTPLTWSLGQQAIQTLKLNGNPEGTQSIDLNSWFSEDGIWEYWFVEDGDLQTKSGSVRRCEPVMGSIDHSKSSIHLFPNPTGKNPISIQSSAPIKKIEAYAINGKKVSFIANSFNPYFMKIIFPNDEKSIVIKVQTNKERFSNIIFND